MNPFVQQSHQSVVEQQQNQRVDKVGPADMWVQTEYVRVRTVGSDHSCHTKQPATGRVGQLQDREGEIEGEILSGYTNIF